MKIDDDITALRTALSAASGNVATAYNKGGVILTDLADLRAADAAALAAAQNAAATAQADLAAAVASGQASAAQIATLTAQVGALTAQVADLQAQLANGSATDQAFAAYRAQVLSTCGPMALTAWERYVGYPINYNGYVESLRDDFDTNSNIASRTTGAGLWYSAVHAQMGNVTPRDISTNPELYSVSNSVLTLRARKKASGIDWEGGFIQTMKADGTGFAQGNGIFESLVRLPLDPNMPGVLQCGFWGGPNWLLAAGDYRTDITDNLIEIDPCEAYGGPPGNVDKRLHTTVHIKPRRVPQPGDYATRQSEGFTTDPQAMVNTAGGAKTYPSTTALADGQFHLYSTEITDTYVTQYFDGLSICRYPNFCDPRYPGSLPYFSTPLYAIISHIVNPAFQTNAATVSPIDMQIDMARVLAKS